MISTGLLRFASTGTPQQQRKDRIMAAVPHVAVAAADVYAAASVTIIPATSGIQAATPWLGGVAAVTHAIYGATQIFHEYEPATSLQIARGCGHFITAAGFAALAGGLGPWALPIIAIGETTRIVATAVGHES